MRWLLIEKIHENEQNFCLASNIKLLYIDSSLFFRLSSHLSLIYNITQYSKKKQQQQQKIIRNLLFSSFFSFFSMFVA
jgi:hypothetical protein